MEKSASVKNIALTYGVGLGLVEILKMVLTYVLNLGDSNFGLATAFIVLTILVYIFGLKEFRAKNDGFMQLKEALKTGMAIALIGGIIAGIYAYIHYSFIYPEFIEMTRETSEKAMLETQNMGGEQLEQAKKISELFTSPFALATFNVIASLFFGFIISLVTGLILKKNNPALEH